MHQEVEAQLHKSLQHYKYHHDKHQVECNFPKRGASLAPPRKDRLKGEGRKLKVIRYGPFKILKKIGENAF